MRVAVEIGDDQFAELRSNRLGARPSEDLFGLRIPVGDDAVFVHLDEGVERGIDDAARQLFAFAQGFLHPPALRHAHFEKAVISRRGGCLGSGARSKKALASDALIH